MFRFFKKKDNFFELFNSLGDTGYILECNFFVPIIGCDEFICRKFTGLFFPLHFVKREDNDQDKQNDVEKGQSLKDKLGAVGVKGDADVFVLEFLDELFGIRDGGDIGKSGIGT